MAKLLPIESVPGLSRAPADDPLFRSWLERIARNTEQQSRLLRQMPTGTASPQAPASNLVVNLFDSPLTRAVTADELWVKDADGNPEVLTNVSLVPALTDLDTGTIAVSTWYYLFVVFNGTTSRLLLSVSSTTPVMPPGYTHKGLITALRTTAGGAFPQIFTQGRQTEVEEVLVLSAGTSTTGAAVSVATVAPPIGRFVRGWGAISDTVGSIRAMEISVEGTRGRQRIQDNIVSTASAPRRPPKIPHLWPPQNPPP